MVFENRNNNNSNNNNNNINGGRVNFRKKSTTSSSKNNEDDNDFCQEKNLNLPTFQNGNNNNNNYDYDYNDDEKKLKPRYLPISQTNWRVYLKSGYTAIIFWIIILIAIIFFFMAEEEKLSSTTTTTMNNSKSNQNVLNKIPASPLDDSKKQNIRQQEQPKMYKKHVLLGELHHNGLLPSASDPLGHPNVVHLSSPSNERMQEETSSSSLQQQQEQKDDSTHNLPNYNLTHTIFIGYLYDNDNDNNNNGDTTSAVAIRHRRRKPDFGNLTFTPRMDFYSPIVIATDDEDSQYEKYRSQLLNDIDGFQGRNLDPMTDQQDEIPKCRSPEWTGYTFPNCNQIHEIDIGRPYDGGQMQDYNVSYLNAGTFRDAMRLKRSETDHIVLKRAMFNRWNTFGAKDRYMVHKEAMILERLSHSPRILGIHSFCGVSVHVDAMRGDLYKKIITGSGQAPQESISQLDNDHLSQNDLTPSEKLQISLEMAESLADLHGYDGGPITHGDTHIEQWLIAPDGSIQLNDFNLASLPSWDKEKGEYCTNGGSWSGFYKSPEEMEGSPQDESRDVYSYGNNIYTLLTGLWPFYDEEYRDVPSDDLQDQIIHGKRPYVDPRFRDATSRTYIESKLVEIMEQCWKHDKKERPKIFEVVEFLRQVKMNATRIGELQPSTTFKIPIPPIHT